MPRLRPKYRRAIGAVWKIALAALGAGVAVVVAYNQWGVPALGPTSSGQPRTPVDGRTVLYLTLAFAVLTMVDKIVDLVIGRRSTNEATSRARVESALVGLLVQVSEETGVNIRHLGVSVFAQRGRRWSRRWPKEPRIVRVARYRLDNSPEPSKVNWAPGKGAVGTCWEKRRRIHRDWHEQLKSSEATMTLASFRELKPDTKDGFTHEEYVGIAHKYSEVCAFPGVSDAGDMLSVMSVDVAAKAARPDCVLDTEDVAEMAAACLSIIRDDIATLDELE